MAQESNPVAKALFDALKAEGDGYHFYMMAAQSSQDSKAKSVFAQLAEEEKGHQAFLKAQYQSVLKTGQLDGELKLGNRMDLSAESPIFSPALKSRIKSAHYEMSSLAIGIQLESSAMNYYRQAGEASQDADLKKFFLELAEWESGHYHALLKQQEMLKEDYWSASGFAPF